MDLQGSINHKYNSYRTKAKEQVFSKTMDKTKTIGQIASNKTSVLGNLGKKTINLTSKKNILQNSSERISDLNLKSLM